jgi:tetratricopeptide (TPR) repeat protein
MISAAYLSRGDLNQSVIARAEPRCGSHVAGPSANVYEARSPGHRSMRARTRSGSQFGPPHAVIGGAKAFLGRGEETEPHINEALRLSPRDIFAHRWMAMAGFAKAQLGADAEAVVWLRRAIDANRNSSLAHFALAATLAWLGGLDEARTVAQTGLALDPSFTIRRFRAIEWSDDPTFVARRERTIEGMRLAGVPEG